MGSPNSLNTCSYLTHFYDFSIREWLAFNSGSCVLVWIHSDWLRACMLGSTSSVVRHHFRVYLLIKPIRVSLTRHLFRFWFDFKLIFIRTSKLNTYSRSLSNDCVWIHSSKIHFKSKLTNFDSNLKAYPCCRTQWRLESK